MLAASFSIFSVSFTDLNAILVCEGSHGTEVDGLAVCEYHGMHRVYNDLVHAREIRPSLHIHWKC